MASKTETEKFLDALRRSRLLPIKRIDALLAEHQLENTAAIDIARSMVRNKLLTTFQAQRLLQGKWRGLVIENYRVLEPLGRGGMGWVYIAEDMSHSRWAAIKVLPSKQRTNEDRLNRFCREGRVGMKLDHPNIIKSLAIDTIVDKYNGKVHYIAMEFFISINLHELMTIQRTIPWPQACDFIGQAARGLHYAHEAGFVHRDIKPDNLLILEDGTVKLLDFGLALVTKKANMPEFQQSDESKNLGTADYVAPEQIRNAMTVDGRADIYSLGGTFYFALTGGPPFPTESKKETIESQLKRDPRPLRELAPDVPDEVAAIVQRMMAKSRSARFATAAEVAEALEPFAERKPVEFDFANVLRARAKSARLRALAAADSQETSQDSIVRAVASSIHLPNSAEIATPLPVPTEVDLVTASERLHADDAKALTERPQAVQGEMPAQGETEQLGALSEVIRDSQTTTTDEHHRLQTEMAELQQQIYALRQDLQHRNEALAQLQAALDEERQRRMAEQQRRAEIEQTLQETLARQQTRAREVQGLSREVQIVQKDVLSKYEPVSSLLHIVEQNSVGMEHESQKKVLVDMFRDEDLLAAVANHSSDSPQDADSAPP